MQKRTPRRVSYYYWLLQLDKYRQHQECERYDEQKKLEEYGLLQPLDKADVGKSQAHKQSAAGGIEYVGISVGKEVGENNNRLAESLYWRECKHRDNKNRLGRRAGDKELDNQYQHIEQDHRKIRRDIVNRIVEILEDGM